MILTTTTRLRVRNLIRTLCEDRNITNADEVSYVVDRVIGELEKLEPKTIKVDASEFQGCVTPLAALYTLPTSKAEKDGKHYVKVIDEWICVLAAENYAAFVKESTPTYRPDGWGDDEDVIQEEPTYVLATCRDMDGIYDVLYC